MSVTPMVTRRLMKELAELQSNPPEGIRVVTSETNFLDVTGIIEGPEGTPYAGGYFRVKFHFTEQFPASPPKCWFVTKIFHPNVGPTGEICVNTLKKDWKSSYGIGHILVTVKCLLIYPNPESALDEEAGRLLLENYDDYCSRAKLITGVHATPRAPPPEFSNTASSSSSPTPTTKFSSTSPTSPSSGKPLSSSNGASPIISATTDENEKTTKTEKGRFTSPAPLGVADSNVATPLAVAEATNVGSKAVKRSATSGLTGAEKRKKALKRL